MNIKPGHNRRLPAYDEKQIEELLLGEYAGVGLHEVYYSYPLNDAQLLVEFVIRLFDHGDQNRFFRKVFKRNGKWCLSADFKTLKEERNSDCTASDALIKAYLES